MKKHLSMLLVLLMLLSLAGCSSGETAGNTGKDIAVSDTEGDAADEAAAGKTAGKDNDAAGETSAEDAAAEGGAEALSDVVLMGGVPASPENIKRCSSSTADDNICLYFDSDTGIRNVLRINEPGIGTTFTIKDNLLVNDVISLSFNSPMYSLYDLWGFGCVYFDYSDDSLEEIAESYALVKQNENWYLFHNTEYDLWRIYREIPGEDGLISSHSDKETEEDQIALFDRLTAQTEIGGIEYDGWGNIVRTTVSSQDTAFKDLSDWHFLQDMIRDYFDTIGLHHQSAPAIHRYDYWNSYGVSSYRQYIYDGTPEWCQFDAYRSTPEEFNDASAGSEAYPVTIAAFDEAFVCKDRYTSIVFAKTGDSYFRIESWVPFNGPDDIQRVSVAFDQVFY